MCLFCRRDSRTPVTHVPNVKVWCGQVKDPGMGSGRVQIGKDSKTCRHSFIGDTVKVNNLYRSEYFINL